MYQVYVIKSEGFQAENLVGEYREIDNAREKAESELAKNSDIKYIIKETKGSVDSYGELIATVIEQN